MFLRFSKLFGPTDSSNTTPSNEPKGESKEDMIDFMGLDDENDETIELEKDDKPLVGKEKGKSKSSKEKDSTKKESSDDTDDISDDETEEPEDSEVDELDEIEAELEGPTEDQLELIAPVRRREILKKYPTLFKDFPYLEKAYYREQQYTELLPTIDDAKTAVGKSQTLDKFENELIGRGDTVNILKAVREESPKAFNKIVDNYLSTLAQVDEKAYHHVLGNTIKHTIISMVKEGERSNNEVLKSAAQVLNQFVFGSSDFAPPTKLSKESLDDEDEKLKEVKEREQKFVRTALTTTINDLNSRVNNAITNTIEANIDPKQTMTDYIRRKASKDALDDINELIQKDSRFKVLTDKLWEKAMESNFSKDSVDRIRSAYVSKSRTLLPSVIKKARNEALRGMGKRINIESDDNSDSSNSKKGPLQVGKPSSPENKGSGKISKASDIPRNMRTIDFLMQD